jgi:hypothetical protein
MGQEVVGTFMQIKVDSKLLVGEMSNAVNTACNLIDTSSKASCRASTVEYGRVIETGSVSSVASMDSTESAENWKEIQAAIVAGTKLAAVITQVDCEGVDVVDAVNIAGNIAISNLSLDGPDNEKNTFSFDYTFDGPTVVTVNVAP